ncbi:winged helix-turn-helix transcriptional regulator [Amycolatopsis magusensis]|uniref:winged helix-turn-helix transcriptional regulator n=1 Tax=Amycolatopsis magusensis TaxID=882444 RepID=UPI0037AC4586
MLADGVDSAAEFDVSYQERLNDAVAVIRGRWTISVLATLALRETQYTDLLATINDNERRSDGDATRRPLSDRVLTDTLRRARQHDLIERRAGTGNFSSVWYRLTPKGRALLRAVRPLLEWAHEYSEGGDSAALRKLNI